MEELVLDFLNKKNIQLSTKTKARGHFGFFCNDKITVAKSLAPDKKNLVLLHEYAHKIHSDMEKNKFRKGGSLEKLFDIDNTKIFEEELLKVTNFVDKNSKCLELEKIRNEFKTKVKFYEDKIKQEYPNFAKSKKFIEYDKYQRKTKCKSKYFLKYDHIKILKPWLFKTEFYSLENIDKDFPDLPENFKNYFYLLSNYRKQKKVQNKIARLKRYYKKPTELFARFIEGLAIDEENIKTLAPNSFIKYHELAMNGYYEDLPELIEITKKQLALLKGI